MTSTNNSANLWNNRFPLKYKAKNTQTHFVFISFFISDFARIEGVSSPEAGKSPIIGNRNEAQLSPNQPSSPAGNKLSPTSTDWPAQSDEDIDRLVAMHQNRSSLSSLGVSVRKILGAPFLHLICVKFPFECLIKYVTSFRLKTASLRFDGQRVFWCGWRTIRIGRC